MEDLHVIPRLLVFKQWREGFGSWAVSIWKRPSNFCLGMFLYASNVSLCDPIIVTKRVQQQNSDLDRLVETSIHSWWFFPVIIPLLGKINVTNCSMKTPFSLPCPNLPIHPYKWFPVKSLRMFVGSNPIKSLTTILWISQLYAIIPLLLVIHPTKSY